MKWLLWLLPVGVIVYFVAKGRPQPQKPAVTNTGTARNAPDPFWKGWTTTGDRALANTTATIANRVGDTNSLSDSVLGWFGGSSTATGPASDVTTNGSGAGQPVDTNSDPGAFDPNQAMW